MKSTKTGMTLPCFASSMNSPKVGVTCAVISWIGFSPYLRLHFDPPLPSQGRGQGEGLQLQFPLYFRTPHLNPLPFQSGERRPKCAETYRRVNMELPCGCRLASFWFDCKE